MVRAVAQDHNHKVIAKWRRQRHTSCVAGFVMRKDCYRFRGSMFGIAVCDCPSALLNSVKPSMSCSVLGMYCFFPLFFPAATLCIASFGTFSSKGQHANGPGKLRDACMSLQLHVSHVPGHTHTPTHLSCVFYRACSSRLEHAVLPQLHAKLLLAEPHGGWPLP